MLFKLIARFTAMLEAQMPPLREWMLMRRAFSTVSGLLVAGASAFSHDIYVKVLKPDSTPKQQLAMARYGTILMAAIVSLIALLDLALIGQLVAIAFSLAGCTIFPLFLLGIWWSGSNREGAKAGLIVGILISLVALVYFISEKQCVVLPAH